MNDNKIANLRPPRTPFLPLYLYAYARARQARTSRANLRRLTAPNVTMQCERAPRANLTGTLRFPIPLGRGASQK